MFVIIRTYTSVNVRVYLYYARYFSSKRAKDDTARLSWALTL